MADLMFCKKAGCLELVVARDLCKKHLAALKVGQLPYSTRNRLPKRPPAPHGLLTCELEYLVPDGTTVSKDACLAIHPSCYDATVAGEYKITGACEGLALRAARIARRAYQVGARAGARAGFHVHVDVRSLDEERLLTVREWLQNTRDNFRSITPSSRWGNSYCQLAGDLTRTAWANYRRDFQTIEFRLHPGTLHPSKIYGWLQVCNQLGDAWRQYDRPLIGQTPRDLLTGDARTYWDLRERSGGIVRLDHPDCT